MKDKQNITADTLVKPLIETYKDVYGFLLAMGVPVRENRLTDSDTLAQFLPPKEQQSLLEALNEIVRREAIDFDVQEKLKTELVKPGMVNIAGFADFTWHDLFAQEMTRFAQDEHIDLNFQFFLKNNKPQFQHYLNRCNNVDELPDILVGKGFSSLMTRRFREKFITPGYFDCPLDVEVNPLWQNNGLCHPLEQYHAFGVEELVVLRDYTKPTSVPDPTAWSDLLKPEYADTVTQMGKPQRDHFGFNTMFYLHTAYGEQGIRDYARTVQYKWHFSKIVKDVGRNHATASPFNVLHRYATLFVRHDADARVLTMSDGNPVSTFFCLVKKDSDEAVKKTARHLFSETIAGYLERAGAIAAHPRSEKAASAHIRWLGWEAVKAANLPYIKDEFSEIAFEVFNNKE